jgi:hypothetical protein
MAPTPARTSSTAKKRTKSTTKAVCRLCQHKFDAITPAHLRSHGYTAQRYERMFGARRVVDGRIAVPTGSVSDPNDAMIAVVASRLTDDKRWVACLADEVGEHMMNGPLRQRLSYMLTTMLSQRARVHGDALAVLSGALGELQEEWRVTQGGHNAGPTDTDTLLRMVDKASKLVKDSEDAVQRTIKLALDEQRVAAEHASALGPSLYSGDGEHLDMPAGMTTGDRETVRNLLALIGKAANEAGTIDVTPTTPLGRGAGEGGPPVPEPVLVDGTTTLSTPPDDEGNGQMGMFNDDPPSHAVTTLHDGIAEQPSDQSVIRNDDKSPAAPSIADPTAITRTRRRRRRRRPRADEEGVNDPAT